MQSRPPTGEKVRGGPSAEVARALGDVTQLRRRSELSVSVTLRSQAANGETQTRTGDTAVFSHVLYQLSYLAATRRC
jgi:hypothetical protein